MDEGRLHEREREKKNVENNPRINHRRHGWPSGLDVRKTNEPVSIYEKNIPYIFLI